MCSSKVCVTLKVLVPQKFATHCTIYKHEHEEVVQIKGQKRICKLMRKAYLLSFEISCCRLQVMLSVTLTSTTQHPALLGCKVGAAQICPCRRIVLLHFSLGVRACTPTRTRASQRTERTGDEERRDARRIRSEPTESRSARTALGQSE